MSETRERRRSGHVAERTLYENLFCGGNYLAYWGHEFFGIADGAVTTFKLASADVPRNGSFSVAVPDFARDSAVASFKAKGVLRLKARESKTGNFVYTLERADRPYEGAEFEIATKYNEVLLYAKPYR